MDKAAEECGIGVPTLKDILRELQSRAATPVTSCQSRCCAAT